MDLLGYAAIGGLERIAIIAGALVVGYWGYRLYAREQSAGMLFMGLACLVLFGALLTGGQHVRAVGESVQLARGEAAGGAPAQEAADTGQEASAAADAAREPVQREAASAATPGETTPAPAAGAAATAQDSEAVAAAPAEAGTDPVENAESVAATAEAPAGADGGTSAGTDDSTGAGAEAADAPGLASAQELGGRIVSVKSANVTLEWTTPPDNSN